MPVRQITTNKRSVVGSLPSQKNERRTFFESSLERDFAYILEFDPKVQLYEEQPLKITYKDELGKLRVYTPDYYVGYSSEKVKPTLIEVKYRVDLKANWKELKPKFMAALKFAASKNWNFKIMTEVEIRTDYLFNAKFLNRYSTEVISEGLIINVLSVLKELEETTPQELLEVASRSWDRKAELLFALWYLVSRRIIGCDLNRRINMHSPIWYITK